MASLNERQQRFVDNVVNGMTPTEAARQAGYGSSQHAGQRAYALQRSPNVQAALRFRLKARITNTLIPTALSVIEEVLLDPKQPGGVRMKAAQLALQAGDFFGISKDEAAGKVSLSEMSLSELERLAEAQLKESGLLIEHDRSAAACADEDDS